MKELDLSGSVGELINVGVVGVEDRGRDLIFDIEGVVGGVQRVLEKIKELVGVNSIIKSRDIIVDKGYKVTEYKMVIIGKVDLEVNKIDYRDGTYKVQVVF